MSAVAESQHQMHIRLIKEKLESLRNANEEVFSTLGESQEECYKGAKWVIDMMKPFLEMIEEGI